MFRRMYFAWGAIKNFWAFSRYVLGFLNFYNFVYESISCFSNGNFNRNVLAIDGTFLKTMFKGILLLACQKDANNSLVILSSAIVDSESAENWVWFLSLTYKDFPGISIVLSDKHQGLKKIWRINPSPNGPVFSRCIVHMRKNMRQDLKNKVSASITGGDQLESLIYSLAKAPSEYHYQTLLKQIRFLFMLLSIFLIWFLFVFCFVFLFLLFSHNKDRLLNYIREINEQIAAWFDTRKDEFAEVRFLALGLVRYGDTSNNSAEATNSAITEARNSPIIDCVMSLARRTANHILQR